MLDTLNLDQLRVFVTIADSGSFSAAARQLRRAQSAISQAVLNLEGALGTALFDRSGWKPVMTAHGIALLPDARAVLTRTEQFKTRALALTRGIEAELSIVVDVMYPMTRLVRIVADFREAFAGVVIRLCTEVLGGVPERVLAGEYDLGIQGSLADIDPRLHSFPLGDIELRPVAAPSHPLSQQRRIAAAQLKEYPQVILTDHSQRSAGKTFSVYSADRILTADLGSKHAMLRAGLGWGFMPASVVDDDIALHRLTPLDIAERPLLDRRLQLFLVYPRNNPPGPARQWFIDALTAHNDCAPGK